MPKEPGLLNVLKVHDAHTKSDKASVIILISDPEAMYVLAKFENDLYKNDVRESADGDFQCEKLENA